MNSSASDATRWRVVGDTAGLPTVSFGKRSLLWWGTIGFVIIEGWTLGICAATYLYLRSHSGPCTRSPSTCRGRDGSGGPPPGSAACANRPWDLRSSRCAIPRSALAGVPQSQYDLADG